MTDHAMSAISGFHFDDAAQARIDAHHDQIASQTELRTEAEARIEALRQQRNRPESATDDLLADAHADVERQRAAHRQKSAERAEARNAAAAEHAKQAQDGLPSWWRQGIADTAARAEAQRQHHRNRQRLLMGKAD